MEITVVLVGISTIREFSPGKIFREAKFLIETRIPSREAEQLCWFNREMADHAC